MTASDGATSSAAAFQVVDAAAAANAVAGGQLRTYRLALVTDPSYATYFGGSANVTAAKVTLINRVTQVYEDETSIRLVLINATDELNLNTAAADDRRQRSLRRQRLLHRGPGGQLRQRHADAQPRRDRPAGRRRQLRRRPHRASA